VRARITIENVCEHTFVRDWISADSIIVDLGMNLGDFARTMQRDFRCTIVGAEANPHLAARLQQSGSVRCHPLAVSAATGTVRFCVDEDNSQASHILPSGGLDAGSREAIEVPSVSLADFFGMNRIGRVDFLKVDVEGAELDILERSDAEVFRNVVQMSVEFHAFLDPSVTPRIQRILSRMEDMGFYWIDFTRTYRDVLLVNTRLAPVSLRDKLDLVVHKYRAGVPNKVRSYVEKVMQRVAPQSGA
jgi:FkbM family methyltransferase